MDDIGITITNENFVLENITGVNIVNLEDEFHYNNIMYIAGFIVVSILCFVFYKLYINKRKQVSFLDSSTENNCYDGICCPV